MLYNESLVPMVGARKHPQALGQPAQVVLAEIWDIIEPLLRHVRATGEATWSEDLMLPLARTGAPEESYFTFTYSPVHDETSGVGGVFCAVVETTDKVIEERRLRLLNALADGRRAPTAAAACAHAASEIAREAKDIPFAVFYLFDNAGVARLAGTAHVAPGSDLAPETICPGDAAPWSFDAPATDRRVVLMSSARTDVRGAAVMPIAPSGGGGPLGMLVCGLSPLLSDTVSYTRFHTLLASSLSQNVSNAVAAEEERKHLEALAQLDIAKTAFFSNVSHEFRTPLTLLLGPAEDALAHGDALSADERQRWSVVHRNALRLSKLVNTLLDFSRIEAGRVDASFEATDLSALTTELTGMFVSAVERGGLSLRLDAPPLEEQVYVDREMWEKIVFNLLSNALKFTFEGCIDVSLRFVDSYIEFVVRDTGIGIAPADLPHVFDRFHRIKGVRARSHEGTGIGLALVSEIAKLHGGQVTVESVEGEGSAFMVRIPRGHAHLATDRLRGARALSSTTVGVAPYLAESGHWDTAGRTLATPETLITATPARQSARIVVADDNADMRGYISRLLAERWDVEVVSNGAAALEAIGRQRPDLVLADVMMPELDGFGLLQAIRADPGLRLVPVILLSARAGEEATTEGLSAGANDYIVKPFSARELLVRVSSTLAFATAAREAHAIEEAARRRLYGHFMQAPFPIAVLRGPHHVFELVNAQALRAWGKDERISGKPLLEGIPELRGQAFEGYLDQVFRTGVAYEARGELARLVRSPGGEAEDVYWDFVYAPLLDGAGVVEGVLVSGFEVTAQVRASQALSRLLEQAEAGERQLRQLVENFPDLAWTARPDGFIDYYNRGWYDYTGTTAEEMQGWGWKVVHDPAKVDAVLERWQHSIATGESFEMEFPLRGADGVFRWFLTRVKPLRDEEGRIVRWFGANTNIDERRRNDDFREMFLGVLGHDLRNPLNTVLVTSRVLTMLPDTPDTIRKKLERVTSSGVRMQRMIEQLLDLTRARLTEGIPVTLSAEELDLGSLLKKIVEEICAGHPNCTVHLDVQGVCAARVDPDRLEQVMSNLLGNALAHGDQSRPIRAELSCDPDWASIAVHNYGTPIPVDFLPLLFNPFTREQTYRQASEGLGLGLYISERIVAAHGGTLSVESSQEAGTRFDVRLPRKPR